MQNVEFFMLTVVVYEEKSGPYRNIKKFIFKTIYEDVTFVTLQSLLWQFYACYLIQLTENKNVTSIQSKNNLMFIGPCIIVIVEQ